MKVFDAHVHIEKGIDSYSVVGLNDYDAIVSGKNYICNSFSLLQAYQEVTSSKDTLTLIFDFRNEANLIYTQKLINEKKVAALKVHSRIQKIEASEYDLLISKLVDIDDRIPIVLDAWYYGSEYDYIPSLKYNLKIVKSFPRKQFIIAHSGSYKILEYFFHFRDLPNVYYELSASLQYLYDSSVSVDLKKLIKWTPANKILFGSDYPYGSPLLQIKILNEIIEELVISPNEAEQIFYGNAKRIYKPKN